MDLLEELLAEREIRKVLALYAQHADDNNIDAWTELFAVDGAMVVGPKRVQGREALRTWISKVQTDVKMRHLMTNANITIESPVSARVVMDMALLRVNGPHWTLAAAPRYNDRLIKTDAGWKFQERVIDQRAPG